MLCNVNPKKKKKTKTTKKNGYKVQKDEVLEPCQKDSITSSLLHPKIFRCYSYIGVIIHIRMLSNSKIGIKVYCLYQLTNKYHRILCLRHKYFQLICSLSSLQLETVQTNVSSLSTKMTNPQRYIMQLIFRKGIILRLRLFKINPNLPRRCNFYQFDNFTYREAQKKKQSLWNESQAQRCYFQNLDQFCLRETSEYLTCVQVQNQQTYLFILQ